MIIFNLALESLVILLVYQVSQMLLIFKRWLQWSQLRNQEMN